MGTGRAVLALLALLLASACGVKAGDWPQWRGARVDNVSRESDWQAEWGEEGPTVAWRTFLGPGYSAASVIGHRAYTMAIHVEPQEGETLAQASSTKRWPRKGRVISEDMLCLDAEGKVLWRTPADREVLTEKRCKWKVPHMPPAVANGRVFGLTATGVVQACDANTGKVLWRIDFRQRGCHDGGRDGHTGAPILFGDKVLVALSEHDAKVSHQKGMLRLYAVDQGSGEIVWMFERFKKRYWPTPMPCVLGGEPTILLHTGPELCGIDPRDGSLKWSFDFPKETGLEATFCQSIATPVVAGDRVYTHYFNDPQPSRFLCVEVKNNKPRLVWTNDTLALWYHSAVGYDGLILGFDQRNSHGVKSEEPRPDDLGRFQCIDMDNGKLLWSTDRLSAQEPKPEGWHAKVRRRLFEGTFTVAGGRLIVVDKFGHLLVTAKVGRDGFTPLSSIPMDFGDQYAVPVLANGRLYVRAGCDMVCFDLGFGRQETP
jgi:outer membrane protein assembly factor BamB